MTYEDTLKTLTDIDIVAVLSFSTKIAWHKKIAQDHNSQLAFPRKIALKHFCKLKSPTFKNLEKFIQHS